MTETKVPMFTLLFFFTPSSVYFFSDGKTDLQVRTVIKKESSVPFISSFKAVYFDLNKNKNTVLVHL